METAKDIKLIIENLNEPTLFKNFINDWKLLNWTLEDWKLTFNQCNCFEFRTNSFIKTKGPIWEKECKIQKMSFEEFIQFQSKDQNDSWIYFDYKDMNAYFEEYCSEFLKEIKWVNFGYPEMNGNDSTIWIGTKGAHTPCHKDTYGCNLIAQIYGRKRWIIFPPEENLQPVRVPFEESSIYSSLNFFYPDIENFKGISNPRTVVLNPGEVLFLPPGWWHYVENLETAISINMWIPLPQDNKRRIEEGLIQLFTSKLLNEFDKSVQSTILNRNNFFILENSVKDYLMFINRDMKLCKTDDCQKRQKNGTNSLESKSLSTTVPNFPDSVKENISSVPKLTQSEFIDLLKEQTVKYNFIEEDEKECSQETSDNLLLKKIINAVCHPEVVSMITEKLLKD